jgi:hypothetical protein
VCVKNNNEQVESVSLYMGYIFFYHEEHEGHKEIFVFFVYFVVVCCFIPPLPHQQH